MEPDVVGPLLVSMHLANRPRRKARSPRAELESGSIPRPSMSTRLRHASGAVLIALGQRLADRPQVVYSDHGEKSSIPTI